MTPRTLRIGLVVCAAAFLAAASAFSQTLADVARQEEARRHAIKVGSTTFTNSSLKPDPRALIVTDGATPSAAASMVTPANQNLAAPPTPANGTAATTAAPAPPAQEKPDEATWRRRATDVRARVAKARAEVAKYTGLRHDDPREQAKLDSLLKRAQSALIRAEESLKAFEQEAATVGVPPNWTQ
jgi:hypothetical protein